MSIKLHLAATASETSVSLGTVSSWVAAIISATATGITLWVRRRDRPEADFALETMQVLVSTAELRRSFGALRMHDEALSILNVGDGYAFRVQVDAVGCRVRPMVVDKQDKRGFRSSAVIPRLGSGEDFALLVWNDSESTAEQRVFKISWLNSPTRHRRLMTTEIRRSEVIDSYPDQKSGPESGIVRQE